MPGNELIVSTVRRWLERIVIGLNLCPFAKQELRKERVRFSVSGATTEEQLLTSLHEEVGILDRNPDIETTVLIHPDVLTSFPDYNQFLDRAERLLADMDLDRVYQIASFHPNYQFAGTQPEQAENFTNRAPYPMLHLLREESLDRVLASTEHADKIPERNIQLMEEMGAPAMRELLAACFSAPSTAGKDERSGQVDEPMP